MLLFLLILIAVYVVTGFYAYQNQETIPVTLFNWHWSGVQAWWPVLAAAVVITLLMVLYMAYAGALHGIRHGSLRRQALTHQATISDLRTETLRLREENARLRSSTRQGARPGYGTDPVAADPATVPSTPVAARTASDQPRPMG